jgi:protein-S-isoprenylcysteine O-methyltransferase Ste14
MILDLFLGFIIALLLIGFLVRNISTSIKTKSPIRGELKSLFVSIILSALIYMLILLRIVFLKPEHTLEFDLSSLEWLRYAGIFFITAGAIINISALITMKNSWRVGIRYEQRTALITNGIFRFSRNPYFLSHDILIPGLLMLYPSLIIFFLFLSLALVFHKMILEEEKYLESKHGEAYLRYKRKVGRYVTFRL